MSVCRTCRLDSPRYHGGFDGTGGQPQNRNARIHGLYARGLQQCRRHCPLFEHCPVPCAELDKLPKNNRPTCLYEAAQYQAALTDAEDRVARMPGKDPQAQHLAPQAVNAGPPGRQVTSFKTNGAR